MINFFKNMSPIEVTILLLIIFVVFGRKVFVSLGKTSGETYKEMKNIKKNLTDAFEDNEPNKKG